MMDFQHLFPQLEPWVANLVNVWPAYIIKPQFAWWEVLHIVSLFILGGCTILVSLRLIGVGMTEESSSTIYRNVRPWLAAGVIGVIASGILIGMANAERLYNSAAFLAKMIGLLAALIFTYFVMAPVAKADGEVGPGPRIAAVVGGLVLALAAYVFLASKLVNVGVLHMVFAAGLIVAFAARGKARLVYLGVLAVLVLAQEIVTHTAIKSDDLAKLDPVNKGFMWAIGLWVFGFALYRLFAAKGTDTGPMPKLVGYASILAWVTVAAAGRWIAFA